MQRFLEAHAIAPNPDLVFNAAQAAEYGEDRARAMLLYTQLLGTTTSDQRKAEAKKKIAALTKLVEKKGPGSACAEIAPLQKAEEEKQPKEEPKIVEAPPPAPPPTTEVPWGLVSVGAGAASLIAGGALVGVGAMPFFDHASAREALASAEANGTIDGVDALYARQIAARESWESWGRPTTVTGVVLGSAGIVAAAAGGILLSMEGGAE
jgi:hypothetical protein